MGVINNVKALISTSKLTNLANAIRNKTGEVESYTVDEMIEKINGMGSSVLTSLNVTTNGIYTPESGVDGFSQVDVDVNPDLRPLSVSENGTYQPDGFDGFSQVSVNTGIKAITGKFEITRNLAWTEAIETSIPHGLGAVPSMIVIWTHNNDEARQGGIVIIAKWINKNEFNFPWSEDCLNPFVERWFLRLNTDANLSLAFPTHNILGLKHLPTATEFHLIETNNTGSYKVGTYYYLLVAGNWEQYADDNSSNVTV